MFFFFKQKTAYDFSACLVGPEMCIRDSFPALLADARQALEQAGLRPDYLEIREPISLRPGVPGDRQLVILVAAYLGSTRLIDNLSVHLD